MKLEMAEFPVKDIRFGNQTAYDNGVLAINKEELLSLVREDNRIVSADLDIAYPEKLSRGLVLVKWWLLAIPHYFVTAVFQGGWGRNNLGLVSILVVISAVALLFTGKYPGDIFKLVIGLNRWSYRVAAYVTLMTDEYPPFRLWDD